MKLLKELNEAKYFGGTAVDQMLERATAVKAEYEQIRKDLTNILQQDDGLSTHFLKSRLPKVPYKLRNYKSDVTPAMLRNALIIAQKYYNE